MGVSRKYSQALHGGATVITVNTRLAGGLRHRFDMASREMGRTAWESPPILPYIAWLRRCWEEICDAGILAGSVPGSGGRPLTLLSPHQALLVWESVVDASTHAGNLLFSSGAARRVQEAWNQLHSWELPPPKPVPTDPPEVHAFASWAASYEERCTARGWMDPARLAERVGDGFARGELPAPGRLVWTGFDDMPPRLESLLETLRRAGTEIEVFPFPGSGGEARRTALPDAEEEAWAAARWTRTWLEEDDSLSIGIVVPALTSARERFERVFSDVLAPGAVLPAGGSPALPFNITEGKPFAGHPSIRMALTLLSLSPGEMRLDQVSEVLHSPFLAGGETEAQARALLDLRLRKRGNAKVSLAAVGRMAGEGGEQENPSHHAPVLSRALQAWREASDRLPARQSPSGWSAAFAGLLNDLGWPGERVPDSPEYQAALKWKSLLQEFAGLDLVAKPLSKAEAVGEISRMAAELIFQPEGTEAPAQIMGLLESAGMEFDHLWVCGLDDENWPPVPRPNPFLPAALQRHHGMPRASMARELGLAKKETARLLKAAPDVIFSHPLLEGDRALRPSPLILALPHAAPETLPIGAFQPLSAVIAAGSELEKLDDFQGPPLPSGAHPQGGAGLFRDQSACPFRAFARHRLHAVAPEKPSEGLDPAERGTLVHSALEKAWGRIGDQATLTGHSPSSLETLLDECAREALEDFQQSGKENIGARMASLEITRVSSLLRDWMEQEKLRAPFRVESREKQMDFEIGGISVTGRVDRIDKLEDGREVVIDYKTGEAKTGWWFGGRPEEPQLPLYCSSGSFDPAGVTFAQLRRQSIGFIGVADDPALFPNATRFDQFSDPSGDAFPSFPAMLAQWKSDLERLGKEFRAGVARVDPIDATRTCAYCGLIGLCRLTELEHGPSQEASDDSS